MRHGIRVVCGLQFQPGALGVLFQQALAFQAATYTLTDQLNQILQLALGWRFNALKAGWSVVAIDVCANLLQLEPEIRSAILGNAGTLIQQEVRPT